MDVGDYETNTVVVANIAFVAFRVYQPASSSSPSPPPSPSAGSFPNPLTDIERALRSDGHLVFTDSLRHAIWHFRLLRKDGSALGAHTLPDLGATVAIGPHTLVAVEEGALDPASLQTGQPALSSAFSGRNAQNTQSAQNAPQGVSSPASALSFFDAAARSPFAPPSMPQSQMHASSAMSPAGGGGMDLDVFQPSPPSQPNKQSLERQESFASQGSRESRESQGNREQQARDMSESYEGPTFAEVSAKVVYNFFISAVLASVAPTYCAKSRAIALNARTFLLPPLDPLWDGRESSRTDSRSLVATLRVTLTTAGALLIGVSHRVVRGLGCSAWACYAGLPPPGASVLTAPWGVFAIVRGVYPPSVLLDDEDDSADELEAEPRPTKRKKKRRTQATEKLTGKKRREQRRRQQQRQERRRRYAVPHVPPEWKAFATNLLELHGISPAVLRKAAWLRLELPWDEEIPDGEPVEILWPSSLCYWSLESPTRSVAPFERLNPLADVRAAYQAQVHAEEEAASGLAKDESKEDPAEDAAMEDIQHVPGLDKGALQLSDGPSPLGTRNPVWLPSGVPGSSVYPTPPDGLPNPVGATPTFDGTAASPGNATSAAAPADLEPPMTETALADDTFGSFWGGDEPKRDEMEQSFLEEPDNMFGDMGADMFGDNVTDADFSFFDEKPDSGPEALPPPTAPPQADSAGAETMEVDSAAQGSDTEQTAGRDAHSTPEDAAAMSSPALPSALASLPSFPGPPQPQPRLPPPPVTAAEESTEPSPKPSADDESGETQPLPSFVKPGLKHAPSRIATGGSIKRPPSPFNALTVFKRVKVMAAADQVHRNNLFQGLRFTEFMIQNTKKYEQSGKFGFSWPHPEADLQSDIASATSPTAFRRPVAGKRAPLSDTSPEFAALVTSITRDLQSSSLQPRRRLPVGGGDGTSDVSRVRLPSDWTDGSSSETDDDDSENDETTDSGIDDYIYGTEDEDGFAAEKRAVDDNDDDESDNEDSNSDTDNDGDDGDDGNDDDYDDDDDDEPLSVHREDRRRKARAMASAVPLQDAAAELSRACSEGVWDFPIARFFADPMPPATELAYADDDIVDVAQILTQQVTRATIGRSSVGGGGGGGAGFFLDDDEVGDGQGLSQAWLRQVLPQHMRQSVATLEASLPASLAADAVRCSLKPYLEVVADAPAAAAAAAAASTNALQPHQPVRPPPMAAAAAAAATAAAAGATGGTNLFPVPPPHVELRRNETMLSLLPTAVEFWEVLGLEPLHGPKDVRAVCLFPAYEGLIDNVRGFLARMRIAYESLRLGSHEPLAALGGMISFAPGGGGGAFPGEEEVQMLVQALAAEDTRGKSVVVYFVYCADVSSAAVEACLAFRRLTQLYARAVAGRSGTGPPSEPVLQLVPTAFLSSPTSLVRVPSTAELLRLSLEVYDRCAAPRGPRPAPSFLLEQPPPRMLDLRLSPTPSVDVQRENSCIHVAYAASADGRWVTAAWSDGSGWRQFSAAYWVARKGEPAAHGFAAVAQEIWDNTCALVANLKVHWRAIVAKCGGSGAGAGAGAFDNDEIEAWTELARSETRASISLTLVRVDAQPSLELLPPLTTALTAPLPAILPQLSAATPVPTPAAGSSAVFSPDQSGGGGGGGGGGNPVTPAASFGAYPTTPATPATPGAGGGGGGPAQSPAGPTGMAGSAANAATSAAAAAANTGTNTNADAAATAKLAAAGADPSAVADVDGNVVLVDITDSTWGAVAAHRRNTAATWVDQRPALVSGYLVKRGGTGADDTPVVLEVDVVRVGWATPSTATTAAGTPTTPTTPTVGTPAAAAARGHDALLREILVAYRALGTLARARGILDGDRDVRPWHVAAAERAAKVLCQRM